MRLVIASPGLPGRGNLIRADGRRLLRRPQGTPRNDRRIGFVTLSSTTGRTPEELEMQNNGELDR